VNDPLTGIAETLRTSKQESRPVSLNAAFLRDCGATPPGGLDAGLAKAFRLSGQQPLSVSLAAADIPEPFHGRLTVTGARLSFLGWPAQNSSVTLMFLSGSVVDLVIAIEMTQNWTFTETFTAMDSWPFSLFPCTSDTVPSFAFTTRPGAYQWHESLGLVTLCQRLNFAGLFPVPGKMDDLLKAVQLKNPGSPLLFSGPFEVDKVTEIKDPPDTDDPVVLYPDMDLVAALPGKKEVDVFNGLLKARDPGIGLRVTTVSVPPAQDEPAAAEFEQRPELALLLHFDVGRDDGGKSYLMRCPVGAWGKTFGFEFSADGAPLTTADAVALIGGPTKQNFLDWIPSPLQQLLGGVGLERFRLAGLLQVPPALVQAGVTLSSTTPGNVPLFSDPTGGQVFSLDKVSVDWTVLSPLDSQRRQNLVSVGAWFHLWPQVFKDGPFHVSVDQDLRVDGGYDGTVSLGDVLTAVSAGTLRLPDGVRVSLSQIGVHLDTPAHTYLLGAHLDASLDLVQWDGRPLISVEDATLSLSASTPPSSPKGGPYWLARDGKATAYRGEFAGDLAIGPVFARVRITYDGTAGPGVWRLHAGLTEPLPLGTLVARFFRGYNLPTELFPDKLQINTFAVDATIPAAGPGPAARYASGLWTVPDTTPYAAVPGASARPASSYTVGGELQWKITWLGDATAKAALSLQYDAGRAKGQEFSGQVVGDLFFPTLSARLLVGYRFGTVAQDALTVSSTLAGPAGAGDSKVLWIEWEGIRGQYDTNTGKLTLNLTGWTVGRLIQALVRTLGDPYFTLDAPWDLLDKVSLDGLRIVFTLRGPAHGIEAAYVLSSPIDLGFVRIEGMTFRRGADNKVTLQLRGATRIESLDRSDLFKQGGQDVAGMPAVSGLGTDYFDLLLLVLGQHVAVNGADLSTTEKVITALEGVPATTGKSNPVNPHESRPGQVRYAPDSNWLVAAHFRLLGNTIDCKLVFNDPDLYGLRIALNGEKAKVLAGLVLDVLYKKVTDDVGLYQVDFTLPTALRTLDFGALSITLPSIGVRIYTNGDFLIDFGFPYRQDFSRSFTLQAFVAGIPVTGSAGFYFGRMSVGAKAELPQGAKGTFGTATLFGVGLRAGVGHTFEKGPLKAGFSVTAFGVVEGIFASWQAESDTAAEPGDQGSTALASRAGSQALQSDYYFRLRGTFGLIGQLYGSVDFGVVKASVNLDVRLSASIVYEAYADIPISASASVSISISLSINLGLFSIDLHFSFAATVTADLTLHNSDHDAPWYRSTLDSRTAALTSATATPALADVPVWKTVVPTGTKPTLTLHPAPQFTVLAPKEGAAAKDQQGAFVLLLVTDAPTEVGTGNASGSSFEALCRALLPWVVDAYTNPTGDTVNLNTVLNQPVSKVDLQTLVSRLGAGSGTGAPLTEADVLSKLLAAGFTVNVKRVEQADTGALKDGATAFPVFTGLSVTFPDPEGGSGTRTADFDAFATVDDAYRARLAQWFEQLAARLEHESRTKRNTRAASSADGQNGQPLARVLFEDWFTLVARQLLQAGADSFADYPHRLTAGANSLKAAVAWAQGRGNPDVTALDIALPNAHDALTAGKALRIADIGCTVQRQDSLRAVAQRYSDPAESRWKTTPDVLAQRNAAVHGLLMAGVAVIVAGKEYTTQPGESFASLAEALGVPLEQLCQDQTLQGRTDLLAPATPLVVPDFVYTTAEGDTLASVARLFAAPLAMLVNDTNQAVDGLFAGDSLRLTGLSRLLLSDVLDTLTADGKLAQTAGMAARYTLHGMRLPTAPPGLTLPDTFRYPRNEDSYGLYQLTGQQFPVPDLTSEPDYAIAVGKNATLNWLRFDDDPTKASLPITLSEQARQLHYLLRWAREHGYSPGPATTVLPRATAAGRQYPAQSVTVWSTSDQQTLDAVTRPDDAVDQCQPQPLLWNLPPALLRRLDERAAALAPFGPAAAAPYLPYYLPSLATPDPATALAQLTSVDSYVYATRVQFQVKKLAQTDGQAPQTPQANSVLPPDAGNAGGPPTLAPFTYELIGPSPADARLLERLLSTLEPEVDATALVTGLFLLLPDTGRGATGLTSRGTEETLAFLTRTNLTTESAPPTVSAFLSRGEGQPPRGIANPPEEVVRLLWELSTVRAGGYYLYYTVPDEGTGLPDSVFDTSGVATLTLVITYSRDPGRPGSGHLTDYVNTLLTTEAIDSERSHLSFVSQPGRAQAAELTGRESLAELSALYGATPAALTENNARLVLPTGLFVPILDGLHQLTADDMATPDPLATVAQYWSDGAQSPLTRSALAAYNPGVTTAAGAVLRIPDVTYVTGTGAGGTRGTLAGIASYYGLSHAALGWSVRDVRGLFPAKARPVVDSQELADHPVLGTGNTGIRLTRDDPGTPPPLPAQPGPIEIEKFAVATLSQLYSLLSVGVFDNAFFTGSPQGLPVGPQHDLTPEQAAAIRRPESRRALLQRQRDTVLCYRQAVGFGEYAKVNPAPGDATASPGQDDDLPSRAGNPYAGVGAPVQLRLRWHDVFGNTAVSSFDAASAALDRLPDAVRYSDHVLGLSQWPNVHASYGYGGEAGKPRLRVSFRLSPAPYEQPKAVSDPRHRITPTGLPDWQQRAQDDLHTFTTIYYQLNQNYGAGEHGPIPGIRGQATTLSWTNSLLARPDRPLTDAEAQLLRDFVAQCVRYLAKRAQRKPGGDAPNADLIAPLDVADLTDGDIVPLTFSLTVRRQDGLTDPVLRSTDTLSDTTEIMPTTGNVRAPGAPEDIGPIPPVSLRTFAEDFEKAFTTTNWRMRVGTSAGMAANETGQQSGGASVWAVRMSRQPGNGLGFTVGKTASFLAPRPLATALRDGTVSLGRYATGQPFPSTTETLTFTGVDLNTWAQQAFSAIDAVLAPALTSPAFITDCLTTDNPQIDGALARLLQHKKRLAAAVARTVAPVLKDSATDDLTVRSAADKLEQALLDRLGAAFTITAVTVFDVIDARFRRSLPPGCPAPRFFGQPQGQPTTTGNDAPSEIQDFSLSAAKVALTPLTGDGRTRLAFLFESKNSATSHVPLAVRYPVTHLEHDITSVPGINDYQQSHWLAFVTGPETTELGDVDFPVVLRALPQPPSVTGQTALPTVRDARGRPCMEHGASPRELARWDYAFSYAYGAAAQDTLSATLSFNVGPHLRTLRSAEETQLFAALAQFVTNASQLSADLDASLRSVNADSTSTDDTVKVAKAALDAFAHVAGALADAYEAWALGTYAQTPAAGGSAVIHHSYGFGLTDDGQGNARVDVYCDKSTPEPQVLIDPDTYTAVRVEQLAPDARYGWEYEHGDTRLPFHRAPPSRTVGLSGLSVFTHQDGYASTEVVRNVRLVPDQPTHDGFVFRTPTVRFPERMVPLIAHASYNLASLGQQDTLGKYLAAFISALVVDAGHDQPFQVKITAGYAFSLQPTITELPLTILPISLLPLTATTPATTDSWIASLVQSVDLFLQQQTPVRNKSSKVSFHLEIFAGDDPTHNLPLLTIGDLYVMTSDLPTPTNEVSG
jgi:hypothetical protein